MTIDEDRLKSSVKEHWERETCGVRYADSTDRRRYFDEVSESRYRLEPYIPGFAGFESARNKRVLEIGVGAGADFENWCRHADHVTGIDLTEAAIALTRERLDLAGVPTSRYHLQTSDAENLPFDDGTFDLVYSWGVLHHTPRTEAAIAEVRRVLRPGGEFRGMIYHHPSWTGWMLAVEYALRRRRIFGVTGRRAIGELLESPGTKAYSVREAEVMLRSVGLTDVDVSTKLGPGDLLTIRPSARYQGRVFRVLWRLYPRPLVRLLGDRFGMNLLLRARAPEAIGATSR